MSTKFDQHVALKFQLYNTLFLNLPFEGINSTGVYLPLLQEVCENGLNAEQSPTEIITKFFTKHLPQLNEEEQRNQLFKYVQYIERQVVLFDAAEDAAFAAVNDTKGKGTIQGLAARITDKNTHTKVSDKLSDYGVRIVLTAHPTQFYHGHVLSIITDLQKAIAANQVNEINRLLKQLGLTKFYHRQKPTPLDEAIALIWYLENVFYKAIPLVFSRLKKHLKVNYLPSDLITMGFWPGGDRDGNPFVTPQITLEVAAKLKEAILRAYQNDIRKLKRRLTFAQTDVLARKIERKLSANLYHLDEQGYKNADELSIDLKEIKMLLDKHYNGLFADEIDALTEKVSLFGFYFASIDIRQDSRVHSEIVLAVLASKNLAHQYEMMITESEKINFLLQQNLKITPNELPEGIAKDTIQYLQDLRLIIDQNGERACERYIISNTQSALNLFELRFLFGAAGWDLRNLPFDLIPLFETVEDLHNAPAIMHEIYSHKAFSTHLNSRKNQQTIMLGFSDGTKDGGYITANWEIYQAKQNLTEVSRTHGIEVLFFDGRGGPPARGGGDTHAFYAAMGKSIENKQIQITIQGQTISSKFGTLQSAAYNIEQLLTAGLVNIIDDNNHRDFTKDELAVYRMLSEHSFKAYSDLKSQPQFLNYLEEITVLNYYSDTNIGSRPAKRKGGKLNLSSLRAIPFVGAWSQMKQNVPGYYGFGTALDLTIKEMGLTAVQKLYQDSLFFRALVWNSMQSLAKTNFKLTAYLAQNKKYSAFWQMLKDEYELTVKLLFQISGYDHLLQEHPLNLQSIQLRERLVLPLLVIQQYALQQTNAINDKEKEQWQKLVVRCFFGNINATRNAA